MKDKINHLEAMIVNAQKVNEGINNNAKVWRDSVVFAMDDLRKVVDLVETKVDGRCWPIPTYMDLLFGV